MATPRDPQEPEDLEDLSELAEKAEDSGVVEISQITELEWDDEEAATRIDPRILAPAMQSSSSAPPPDTVTSPPPMTEPQRAGPPIPRSRAPTLLGVAAASPVPAPPAAPGAIVYAPTMAAPATPPVSPFMQVADPVPAFRPSGPPPAFPEMAFEEGVAPDYEAAAQARLAASPVFQAPAPTIDFGETAVDEDDIVASRSRSKGGIGLAIGGVVALVVVAVVVYALFFSAKPGGVVIRTTIPGATVTVDGQPLGGNPGFFVASELEPGPHTFTLSAPGMAMPITQTIVVEADRTIDGPVDLGATALAMGPTNAGPGMTSFPGMPGLTPSPAMPASVAGMTADPLAATAAPATAAPATAAPEPETAAPALTAKQKRLARAQRPRAQPQKRPPAKAPAAAAGGQGFLTVQTTPWSAVSVDGRPVGNTPVRRHALRAGSHTVSMVNSELRVRHTQRVNITEGAEVRVIRQLQP